MGRNRKSDDQAPDIQEVPTPKVISEKFKKTPKELQASVRQLGQYHIRALVDIYYQRQRDRCRLDNQVRAAEKANDPVDLLENFARQARHAEADMQAAMDEFTQEYAVTRWMRSIVGIGPVLSAGLLAHLDIRRAETAGSFWSFAGYTDRVWEKGQKRPWNARLKTLLYKAATCFVKFQNHENQFYGTYYRTYKERITRINEAKGYEKTAAQLVAAGRFKEDTVALASYRQGKLPAGHINARALRYLSKLFLSHVHHVMYWDYHQKAPPVPFVFAKSPQEHAHFIAPPNFPWTEGGAPLSQLYAYDDASQARKAAREAEEAAAAGKEPPEPKKGGRKSTKATKAAQEAAAQAEMEDTDGDALDAYEG